MPSANFLVLRRRWRRDLWWRRFPPWGSDQIVENNWEETLYLCHRLKTNLGPLVLLARFGKVRVSSAQEAENKSEHCNLNGWTKVRMAKKATNWKRPGVVQESSNQALVVIVNGVVGQYINSSRGLRQGDPMSPLLFTVIMKCLRRCILHSVNTKKLSGPTLPRVGKALVELFFVDDIIFFLPLKLEYLQEIKSIMADFETKAGMRVNDEKLVTFNAQEDVSNLVVASTGWPLASLLLNYLGLPLFVGKLSFQICQSLVLKVQRKLASWKASLLSYAGRPKGEGGVGLRSIADLNRACLGKLALQVGHATSPWASLVSKKYLRNHSLWTRRTVIQDDIDVKRLTMGVLPHLNHVCLSQSPYSWQWNGLHWENITWKLIWKDIRKKGNSFYWKKAIWNVVVLPRAQWYTYIASEGRVYRSLVLWLSGHYWPLAAHPHQIPQILSDFQVFLARYPTVDRLFFQEGMAKQVLEPNLSSSDLESLGVEKFNNL
ncbi:retrotransposable element ORF2 protein [Nymphaea thermarum]|nr:retrotransposable element ORF2 protein [Nymphaea thermarum]